jgi:hypothetical protein
MQLDKETGEDLVKKGIHRTWMFCPICEADFNSKVAQCEKLARYHC